MDDLLTYRLEDLLLFSPRVYWRLFERYNAAFWPLQLPALLIGLSMVLMAMRPRPWTGRLIAAILALGWIHVGWAFIWQRYGQLHWAMAYVVWAYLIQAVLLLSIGTVASRLRLQRPLRWPAVFGLLLAVHALLFHPLLPLLLGRPFSGAEIFALAPDPTAILTLGFALAAAPAPAIWLLMAIPMAWCLFSGLTLLAMNASEAASPLIAGLVALGMRVAVEIESRQSKTGTSRLDLNQT